MERGILDPLSLSPCLSFFDEVPIFRDLASPFSLFGMVLPFSDSPSTSERDRRCRRPSKVGRRGLPSLLRSLPPSVTLREEVVPGDGDGGSEELKITLDLPGVAREDLSVSVTEAATPTKLGVVTIRWARDGVPGSCRTLLSQEWDRKNLKGLLKDGVLTLSTTRAPPGEGGIQEIDITAG